MRAIQITLCFVFVSSCFGQGDYGGRRRGGFRGDSDIFEGGHMGGGLGGLGGMSSLMSLQGGGMGAEPLFIKNIIGSTVSGRILGPGEVLPDGTQLPRHGGTRNPSGLLQGWGNDMNVPMIDDGWSDPLNGMQWPSNYAGEELVFDQGLNRYVIAQHNAQKAGSVMPGGVMPGGVMPGGIMPGGVMPGMGGTNVVHGVNKAGASGIPSMGASPMAAQTGHGMAKASIGQAAAVVDQQTFGGVSRGEPIANQIAANQAMESLAVAKNTVNMASNNAAMGGVGGVMPLGGGMPMGMVPSMGMGNMPLAAGKPMMMGGVAGVGHNIAKATGGSHIGLSRIPGGPISAGTIGVHPGPVIGHNVRKATMGADAAMGHNIAKSANVLPGIGIMNPGANLGMPLGSPLGSPLGMSPVMGTSFGMGGTNVVHETNMAGMSGIPAIGASPLAAQVGHQVAKQSVGQAAAIVDRNTFGGVSRGHRFPNQIASNLARETMHVGQKTVDMAAANTNAVNSGIPFGNPMMGGQMPMGSAMMGSPMIAGGVSPMIGGGMSPMIGGGMSPMIGGRSVMPMKKPKMRPIGGYGGRKRG